jgi:hypothetical protein
MDKELKRFLDEEAGGVKMSDELFERFVGSMTEMKLRNKEVLVPYGKIDTNLYVQKNGILRACYMDGENEKTYGFGNPGSVLLSYHSYFMHRPSVFKLESCDETDVLKMSKKDLDELLATSHEFALWLLATRANQLYTNELKSISVTGSAKERYEWLIKHSPMAITRVSSRIIASYLGVTPTYLSFLKKSLLEEGK